MPIKKLIIIIVILSVSSGYTQNLVPNPSFENLLVCPSSVNFGNVDTCLVSWSDPTEGSPDCFNVCSTWNILSIPSGGGGGFQYARTGNGYAGLIAYQGSSLLYREYIHNQLSDSLKQDSCYYMEFYVNKTNYVRYAVNLGCYISSFTINTNTGPFVGLNYTPQIEQSNAAMLTDTLNWVRINGTYKASGGEQYITIGNFDDNNTIDTLTVGNTTNNFAHYYIEDVALKLIPNNISSANAGTNQSIIQGDSVQIGNNPLSDAVYSWYPNVGLNDTTLENPIAKPSITTTYYCIKDACNSQTIDSVTVTVTPTSVSEVYNNEKINIYPNPNKGTFNVQYEAIEGEQLVLSIQEITGKIVHQETLNSEYQTQEIITNNLETGLYLINIRTRKGELVYSNKMSIFR